MEAENVPAYQKYPSIIPMRSNWPAIVVVASAASLHAAASPIEDLASPDQEVRDKAAAELRRTFQSTPESKWTPILEKVKKGQTKKEILELLAPFKITIEMGGGSGQSHSECYRLDNEWLLRCDYLNNGDILFDRSLIQSMRGVPAIPPKNFSGKWTVYFVNGNKSREISMKDGHYFGEFIAYRSNGTKAYVQHYTKTGADGEDTGYHPSGKVAYRGQYKDGKQVGTWTWYDENGNVTSTRESPSP